MLRALADGYFDGRRRSIEVGVFVLARLVLLHHGLHGVAKEFADDVLQMGEDVREGGVLVTQDFDFRDGDVWAVCPLGDVACRFSASLNYFFRHAFEKDFADEFGFGQFSAGREPGRVEGVG
jgi:hypothetical protein